MTVSAAEHFERVVVTGGAGFVGSHLCERLVCEGTDVLCLDNLATGAPENIAHLSTCNNFRFQYHDVLEPIQIRSAVDVVFHLASPASPSDYLRLPVQTLQAGSLGTYNALQLALHTDARLVFTSTSEVYGNPQIHPQPEWYWGHVNPIGPRSVYDEAKRFGEAMVCAFSEQEGVNSGIVRVFNTYGPRMRVYDGRAVPTFIRQALTGKPLSVTGNGAQTRSLCYVDDLVDGLLAMAESRHSGPVNLGNPEEQTVLQIAEQVIALSGSNSEIVFVDRPVDDPDLRCPDISTAQQVLGWSPRVRSDRGIRSTIDWYAQDARIVGSGWVR
ncbi:NAD-dependent epimerase/dehydratase family protein [Antrihabitans spumae]|uniref:NAD-dependent epimerase/dehydratase family protein n=1 Tax=Antrihabitans spumae TaxID=3373370 RepID=A0ABW7KCF8_9NOCA